MTALYDITNAIKRLQDISIFDDVPPEVLADTLESLEGDFDQKALATAKFIANLEADAVKIQEAAQAMRERAARVQRRADSVKAYLHFQMQSAQRQRIDSPELVIRRQNNPPAVVIDDEDAIPDRFWRQLPPPPQALDKAGIKDALRAGEEVPGARLEAGERLSISL